MSKTANTELWNQTSNYHELREGDAARQVADYLFPVFMDKCVLAQPSHAFRVADFACGGGAIAKAFLKNCVDQGINISHFLLIDVTEDNLNAAGSALAGVSPGTKIEKFLCDGSSLSSYSGPRVDFLYCWDAMVHFDILDVAGYLRTLQNVLQGVAFMHHSNYFQLTRDIKENPHWRNFMNKDIFMQMCMSAGHEVMEQRLLDWELPGLDCLTTIRVASQ